MIHHAIYLYNESHNVDPFVVVENELPTMGARIMVLMKQVAKTNENIAMLMANQVQPNMGTHVVIQTKENDPIRCMRSFGREELPSSRGKKMQFKLMSGSVRHILSKYGMSIRELVIRGFVVLIIHYFDGYPWNRCVGGKV